MKRLAVAVVSLVVFAAGAYAQDAFYAFHAGHIDVELPRHPCGPNMGLKGPASMTVYDTNPWIVYTCQDDRVILSRYINPNDSVRAPQPVFVVGQNPNDPAPALPVYVTPAPAALPVCPAGFVHTKGNGQGCVPPNHPLADVR